MLTILFLVKSIVYKQVLCIKNIHLKLKNKLYRPLLNHAYHTLKVVIEKKKLLCKHNLTKFAKM